MDGNKYRKTVDWELMRHDWVAGVKSVLQLSKEYDVSRAAILKHWDNEGIERNLASEIKAKADLLVTQSLVTPQVTQEMRVTKKQIVDANAQNNAAIQIGERKDVTKARTVVMSLLDELDSQVANKELYEKLGEMLFSPDAKGIDKLNEIYSKVISFGGRVDGMKKLSDSLKVLIDLERRVYKIDDVITDGNVEEFLRKMRGV